LRKTVSIFIFCCVTFATFSQTRKRNYIQRELGFYLGGSYYLGDLNPRKHFLYSRPAVGLFFRYTTNYRYAFKFGFNYGTINASDAKSGEIDQLERNLSFRSRLYEFNSTAEFNFVEYRVGNSKYPFTMYIFAGLAGYFFNPQSDIGRGYESLSGLKTEGRSYPKFQMSVPFGIGFKWNIGRVCGLGIEWGPRRTFTDYLDDVSGTYPDFTQMDSNSDKTQDYSDTRLGGAAFPGSMRGNPRTKDWYFFYGITLNIKLRPAKQTCHGAGMSTY
jgi:hypothetical protein